MDSWREEFSKALEINDKRRALSALGCAPSVDSLNDTSDGLTVLQVAVSRGELGIARSIVNAGADVNKKSEHVQSPLIIAAAIGRADIVELLLDAGAFANPPEENPTSTALLCAAISSGDRAASMFQLLLAAGAHPNARQGDGATALHTAAKTGAGAEAIAILVEAGADINALTNAVETPLHIAADGEVFQQLLDLGADITYMPQHPPVGYVTPLDNGLRSQVDGIRAVCQTILAESSARQIEGVFGSSSVPGEGRRLFARSSPSL